MDEYGVSTGIIGTMDCEQGLRCIAAAGFRAVELAGPQPLDDLMAEPAVMRRSLEGMGLCAASVHLPPAAWNVADPDDDARRAAIDAALACLRQAAAVGVQVAVCHPNAPGGGFTVEDAASSLRRSRASLEVLAEEARARGVRLALENLPSRHMPRPGSTMADVLHLIDGLGDHVGVCLDAGHSNANGYSPADEARLAGERLWALHIQDNDGRGEDQHLIPGQGSTDWPVFLTALQAMRFDGLRTFEVGAAEDVPETLAALRAIGRQWNEG